MLYKEQLERKSLKQENLSCHLTQQFDDLTQKALNNQLIYLMLKKNTKVLKRIFLQIMDLDQLKNEIQL